MAVILERAFQLLQLSLSPAFADNAKDTWYSESIQTAADHCVLRGDGQTSLVRPTASMTRAEMIVMFDRAQQQQRYGQDCFESAGDFVTVLPVSSKEILVTFNIDIDPDVVGQMRWYTLIDSAGANIDITNIKVVNSRLLHLQLATALKKGSSYSLRVTGIRSQNDNIFNALRVFTALDV